MASTGKNKHKLKGKTLNLNDFLEKETNYVVSSKHTDWATEMENAPEEEWGPETHPFKTSIDRSILPTAPRAARGPDIDMNRVPTKAPFIAFLGNLPFNMDQDAIQRFFRGMNVISVRLPKGNEAGRKRGFGYAEFADRDSLLLALAMNNETLMNRKIRIDLAENEKEDKDRRMDDKSDRTAGDWRRVPDSDFSSFNRGSRDDKDDDRRDDQPDRTAGDWRRVPDSDFSRDDRDSKNDRFQEPSDRNFDDRDRGYDRGDRDRGYNDRSGFNGRFDRGHSSDRERGYGSDRERGYNDRGRGDRYDRNDRFGGNRYNRDGDRDQDRGFDRNSRRTFGSGFSNDRDGYTDDRRRDDRQRDDRFGSLNRRGGFGDSRYERTSSPDKYKEDSESEKDPPRGRQKLVLKPRTVPISENVPPQAPQTQASIFGGAKPVDTAARERQIEERLARERDDVTERIRPQEGRERDREYDREVDSRERDVTVTERTEKDVYNESPHNYQKEEKDFNNRKTSSSSVKSDKSGSRSRVDSERSGHSQSETDDEKDRRDVLSGKPPSPKKEDSKAVPAPIPKENAWQKRAAAVVSIPPSGSSNERRDNSRDRAGSDRENRSGYNTTPRTKRKSSSGSSTSNGPRRASVDYGRERRPSVEQRPPSGRRGSEDASAYTYWDKRRDTSRNRTRDDSRNRRRDDPNTRPDVPPQRSREDNHYERGRGRGDRPSDRGRGRSDRGGDRQFDRGGDRQFDRGGSHPTHKNTTRDISDRPPRRAAQDRIIKYEEPKPMNWTNANKYTNLLLDDDDTRDSNSD